MSEKRRVLAIGPDPVRSRGGMATVIAETVKSEVLRAQYEMESYPSFIDGSLFRRVLFAIRQEAAFKSEIGAFDIYHIHVASGESTWRKMRYVKRLGGLSKRVVLHVHGARYHRFFMGCNERQKNRIRALFASVGAVIVLSEEWRAFFEREKICDPLKISVVHNATGVPNQGKTDYTPNNVLFMGKLGERKSPDVLLKAAALVAARHPEANYVFGGDGDVEGYKKLAHEFGVANVCTFAGWVTGEAKEQLFSRATIYCLPSKDEGMPMSVLEAMSNGLAVVTTPVGGIPQVIEDGVNGLLIPVGDHEALASRLSLLMDNPSLKQSIGEAGRRTIQEKFGPETFFRKIAAVYERICK